jgi:hypothetical protein
MNEVPTPTLEALMTLVQAAADSTETARVLRGLAFAALDEARVPGAGALDEEDGIHIAAERIAEILNARHRVERVAS